MNVGNSDQRLRLEGYQHRIDSNSWLEVLKIRIPRCTPTEIQRTETL